MELQIGGVAKTEVGLISSQAYREGKIHVLESVLDLNFRLGIQTKLQLWPVKMDSNLISYLLSKLSTMK